MAIDSHALSCPYWKSPVPPLKTAPLEVRDSSHSAVGDARFEVGAAEKEEPAATVAKTLFRQLHHPLPQAYASWPPDEQGEEEFALVISAATHVAPVAAGYLADNAAAENYEKFGVQAC